VKHSADQHKDCQSEGVQRMTPRVNILGVGVTPVNLGKADETLEKWRDEGRREYVCCTLVQGLVEAQRDREMRSALLVSLAHSISIALTGSWVDDAPRLLGRLQ